MNKLIILMIVVIDKLINFNKNYNIIIINFASFLLILV